MLLHDLGLDYSRQPERYYDLEYILTLMNITKVVDESTTIEFSVLYSCSAVGLVYCIH